MSQVSVNGSFMTLQHICFAAAMALGFADPATACTTPANAQTLANDLAAQINSQRSAAGLPPLRYDRALGTAAMVHACDMANNTFFDHRGSNGSSVQDRVRASGYRACFVAENLAYGYPSGRQTVAGWMGSAGHRANLLHRSAAAFGIGITMGENGPNWVLVLARGC